MALDGFHVVCLEPGADNPKKHSPPPEPEPPEGFVDNTVKVFRLNPDGSKGEFLGTMPAFPEGWDDPHKLREKRFQKQSKEVKEMPKKDIDFEAIVAKAKQIMTEQDVSLYKASGIVAQETGLHRTTVYNRAKAMEQIPGPEPVQAANQEPEREEAESATQSVAQEEPEITVKDVLQYELAQREQGFGPEDDEPIPYQVVGKYEALGKAIGALVDEKNLQYGDAFNRGGCILEILYPDGVRPDQYRDMLGVIRVIDKLFRVANGKQGSEDPWQDIAGYGLLGTGE
jgi:hypothetical protein